MRSTLHLLLALAAALLAPVTLIASPTLHRPDRAGWTILVPDGWELAPPEVVENVTAALRERAQKITGSQVVACRVALRPAVGEGRFIVVQEAEPAPRGMSFDALVSQLRREATGLTAKLNKATGERVELSKFESDPAKHTVTVRGVEESDGTRLRTVAVTYFGSVKTVSIQCAAPEAEFAAAEPEFLRIAAGLTFDRGQEYEFKESSPAVAPNLVAIGIIIAGALGIVGIARAVMWYAWRR